MQSHISNLDIMNDAKLIVPKIKKRSLLTPLFCFLGAILLVFNVYCFSFLNENDEYLIQASKVKNFLGAISIIYAEFSPGSVKEIRIQNSGMNGRITLLDEKFTTSIIEKKTS